MVAQSDGPRRDRCGAAPGYDRPMIHLLALLLACSGSPALPAPTSAVPAATAPAAPAEAGDPLLRAGWERVSRATGDLNGDNILDEAVILSREQDGELEATLRVGFLHTEPGPPQIVEAPRAVCARCGGVKGAPVPFEVEIDPASRVLSLGYFGGSREVRVRTTKWREKGGALTLIGVVEGVTDTLGGDLGAVSSVSWEANLSTLKMTETVDRVSGPAASADALPPTTATTTACAVPASARVALLAYDHEAYTAPRCTGAMVE